MMVVLLTSIGIVIAFGTLAAMVWSIVYPERRLWPPNEYTALTPILVWVPTFTLFGTMIGVGVMEWGSWSIPAAIRYGLGGALIALGNLGVWSEVMKFGVDQTGGASGVLRTGGLYRYSRNPQYVSDMMIVLGWMLMSASPSAFVIGLVSVSVLIVAPFAEEPWLRRTYGERYADYATKVRRFL
ncbi:isoprenylcysteine carboxylmethyltransferase family protein [uncultured Tateyamaria sp.]|uniref:methyltransferase family protein n=1 Tax=uncultured Tateyamaria sp. TaxID=455651 RepID=UPI002625F47E|nr:PEMT/PEM2 methyltransferase family protein [uncultured Tateyamaria sp.]